ncbi:MAG: hypothetical protein CMC19_06685 [Flavobacteriaceae bacterium]|nr:hypothetical protein [Flavobacteriaceae bacterium]OUX39597.1 MAG: hypothetical protein CBE25_03205 [Flavobacteriaceae bacterium TMED265]
MRVIKALFKIPFSELIYLIRECLKRPLYIWPTLAATKNCMLKAQRTYGDKHHGNDKANAFRHAYWCYLISNYCYQWSRNTEDVCVWTKKITDFHERCFVNNPVETAMDLHNNQIGIQLFKQYLNRGESEVIEALMSMVEDAKAVDVNQMPYNTPELVYLNS